MATSLDVDVAIVGGGFSGLWTARELLRRDHTLRVAVLERDFCGYGASGRNGGWASALFPVSDATVADQYGVAALDQLRSVLRTSVRELGRLLDDDGIDADLRRGGTLTFARSALQATRLQEHVVHQHALGDTDADLTWLTKEELRPRAWADGSLGAMYSPHCAKIHPAKAVRGLAAAVERLGGQIFEGTTVRAIHPRRDGHAARVLCDRGTVRASYVIRATEGFTSQLPGAKRVVAPVYSLMIVSEPQPLSFFEEYGFHEYETFADDRHVIVYGQRTADNRIAFGGRGAPYHFGSTVASRYDRVDAVHESLLLTLREFFPHLTGGIDARWGGPLGMPRDLHPYVEVDHDSGLGALGGYTGDGVVLSFVAANAIADAITQPREPTEFSSLYFVNRRRRTWEPEPLRWLGINAALSLAARADHAEERRGRTSFAATLLRHLYK